MPTIDREPTRVLTIDLVLIMLQVPNKGSALTTSRKERAATTLSSHRVAVNQEPDVHFIQIVAVEELWISEMETLLVNIFFIFKNISLHAEPMNKYGC